MVGVNDILRIALGWRLNGVDEIINVHTLRVLGGAVLGDDGDVMDALADLLLSELYANVDEVIANDVQGDIITGLNLTEDEVLPPVANPVDGLESTAHSYASQVSGLICLNGNQPRRQGRSYLPPSTEGSVTDGGFWGASTITAFGLYATALLGPMTTADLSVERVICRTDGSLAFTPTSALVMTYPRTQRRRTPGFGS